jgi:hypothetical protein
MKIAELHPEDLIDREAAGTLTGRERAILDGHLAHCLACRFEQRVRHDFADELDDAPLSSSPTRARSRRARVAVMLVAATLTAAGMAVAARYVMTPSVSRAPEPQVLATQASETHVLTRSGLEGRASQLAPVVSASAIVATPGPTGEPSTARAPTTTVEPPPVVVGASTMFALANEARRTGDHVTAARIYRELLDRHATSVEAPPAQLALGRLLLDDGAPASALPLFDAYLEIADRPLREEAFDGRARALGALHRDSDERAAWTALLASFPQSVHAEHARRRLDELAPR